MQLYGLIVLKNKPQEKDKEVPVTSISLRARLEALICLVHLCFLHSSTSSCNQAGGSLIAKATLYFCEDSSLLVITHRTPF